MIDFESKEAASSFVKKWQGKHNPILQAKKDAASDLGASYEEGITYFVSELERSYNEEAQIISYQFHSREADLYKKFQQNDTLLETKQKEYFRLRQNVGDRDPEVFVKPFILLVVSLISFVILLFTNTYLMKSFISIQHINWLCGALFSAENISIGYFFGRLLRQYGFRHRLILILFIIFLGHCVILFLILDHADFVILESIICIANLIALFLVATISHLAFDIEPHYPLIKKEYDSLVDTRQAIASERLKNYHNCSQAQHLLQAAAMHLRNIYFKHLFEETNNPNLSKNNKAALTFQLPKLTFNDLDKLKTYVEVDSCNNRP